MKRVQPSGCENRKKKKAKEDEDKKNAGGLTRFLVPKKRSHPHVTSSQAPRQESPTKDEGLEAPKPISAGRTSTDAVETPDVAFRGSPLPDQPDSSALSSTIGYDEELRSPGDTALESDIGEALESGYADKTAFDAELDNEAESSSSVAVASNPVVLGAGSSSQTSGDVVLWPTIISQDHRRTLFCQGSGPFQNLNSDFSKTSRPGMSTKGGERILTKEWFYRRLPNGEKILRTWLVYSPAKYSIYCFCCRLFTELNGNSSKFASEHGFSKWWKINPKIAQHESSAKHLECFAHWKTLEVGLRRYNTIDRFQEAAVRAEEKNGRQVLRRLLDIIR